MHYSKIYLPEEIVLIIFNFIKRWKDRYQFAITSQYFRQCILKNGTVRQVNLSADKNLLKFILARSVILKSDALIASPDHIANTISICQNLQTIIVENQLVTVLAIENLLRAAAESNKHITVMVPTTTAAIWKREYKKLQLRADAVTILSEYDDNEEEDSVDEQDLVNDFLSAKNYHKCKIEPLSESFIAENIEEIVTDLGNTFIRCILLFENVKFLITSFDVFSHLKNIDDCGYDKKWLNKKVFARIHNKNGLNNDYYEVSVIIHGCIELLAIGGIVAFNGEQVETFLGSSVKVLRTKHIIDGDCLAKEVYVESHNREIVRSNRLLRQYYKQDSCKLWSFHLKATFDTGFFPLNPIDIESHPSVNLMSLVVRSFILKCFAQRKVDHDELNDLLRRVKNSKVFMKKALYLDDFKGSSFSSLFDCIQEEGKWKGLIKLLKMFEAGRISLGGSREDIVTNKQFVMDVNSGFLSALSKKNDTNAKIAKLKMLSLLL